MRSALLLAAALWASCGTVSATESRCCRRLTLLPAADAFPPVAAANASSGVAVEPLFSRTYLKLAFRDVGHVVTAPARWDGGDWTRVGLATAAVVGTAALLDDPIRDALDPDPDGYDGLADVEKLGEASTTIPLLGVFYLSGLALDDDRARAVALDGLVARTIANKLVTANLKRLVGRGRPYLERGEDVFRPFESSRDYRSFPSGHATEAFTVASVIATHYADTPWVPWTAYGLASVVGYARMKHDQHWASDVLAGALIGTAIGREVVAFNRERRGARLAWDVGRDGASVVVAWEW
jgi:hypothetical protein